MYGVPQDLDLSAFVGAALDEIGLDQYVIQFRFQAAGTTGTSGRLNIGVEGEWELRDSAGEIVDQAQPNADRDVYRVHRVLGSTVVSTEVNAPRSIVLRFSSGEELRIFDNSEHYESFSIQPGDIFI